MTTIELTEEQAAAMLRAKRVRVALEEAPRTMQHLRELIGAGQRTERGEVFQYARTPLLTHITDDADETYTKLMLWVSIWADHLPAAPPALVAAYRVAGIDEPMGFRPGTTPYEAFMLTTTLASWLLWHGEEIDRRDDAAEYQDSVSKQVWQVRAARGLSEPRPATRAVLRECPFGHLEVKAVYFGEPLQQAEARGEFDFELATADERKNPKTKAGRQILDAVDGVRVVCGYCGWSARPKVSEIAGWLG